ncbi:LytR C-terminal domain-containing protein [Streptomyces sp. NPDC048106]|uniref:LytR C-terminal domain-containing protein n=1 Tax=Streptomyces sp. NPDC048106 TaxID=3155750 RepID=UPI0034530B96
MSMLTPPGMGGKYRITGTKYPRMRRPRRRGRLIAAVLASACALGLLGWGTLQLIDVFSGGGSTAEAAKECRTKTKADAARATNGHPAKALPAPGRITVNVYNATERTGLAKDTADQLKKRGFKIGDVGNAGKDYDKKVKGAGVVLGPVSAVGTSLPVLGAQVAGAEQRPDGRKEATLDLVLGDGFKGLVKAADANRTLTALTAPAPTTPVGSAKKGC